MDKKISIVIPFLNEGDWPYKTIQSIYNTTDSSLFEIIAVDDCSKDSYDFSKFPDVKYIRNNQRIGSDGCRQMGVEAASTNCCFSIDAHTLFFNDNWCNKIIDYTNKYPDNMWCCVCCGLDSKHLDINKTIGRYFGANLLFFDKSVDPKKLPSRECLEAKWTSEKDGNEYEIPCILGGNYFFAKDRFMYLKGLIGMEEWGSTEVMLSLKNYMAGGKNMITKMISTAHYFRNSAPYVSNIASLYQNKILICKTVLPDNLSNKIIDCLPKNRNLQLAMEMIEKKKEIIEEHKKYYKSIFTRSIYDYCQQFNIQI